MSKIIVVTGVTGVQGGSVARTFLQLPDWHVRGITRNPSGAAAQALAAQGVEIVRADLDDKVSLARAFGGAHAIFSNTDFFTHLSRATQPGAVQLPPGHSAGEYAYGREVEQGVNVAEAASSPSVLRTLERFVVSSLSEASKWSRGKHATVYHFDSKAAMLRAARERFPRVAALTSTLQMGHYVENWKSLPSAGPRRRRPDGSSGGFVLTRTSDPSFEMPFVVAHKDTGAFVKALVVDLPAGKDLVGVSEYMTLPAWAELWGRVHGVDVEYRQVSSEELFEGVPEPLMREIRDGFDYIHEFGLTGGDPDVLEPSQLDFKIPVTSMEEYIRNEDWSAILNPLVPVSED
ncbi:hypothetical protein N3K66_006153 [Trichothecium roseum]|uniref:Uncharacterized protein n=1 Tax=Trichothecium roseum TaxID=47278 RepID=A0ACC0UZW9_9HYPO|nr:hypothetical protein N3K66_006153 [Trichothecium roseum]